MEVTTYKTSEERETQDGVVLVSIVEYTVIDGMYTYMDRFICDGMTENDIQDKIVEDYKVWFEYVTK